MIKRTRRRIREAPPQEFLDLWRSLKLRAIHRKGTIQAAKLRGRTNLKLHFGCGPKIKPGWVNIDIDPSADIQLDLRRPLPLETGIAAVVYSEHFLEHLDYPE